MFFTVADGTYELKDEVGSVVDGEIFSSNEIQAVGQKVEQSGPNLPGGHK
jgi:hypothetical protein